jgi:hypothetical protein
MLLFLALPLLLLQTLVTGATPSKHHKRWLGVQPLIDEVSKGPFGPWPPICTSQAVRYCFANTRSQTNLEPIVNQAVAKWAHAFLNSALQIIPDNEEALLCTDPSVRADALVISDATRDNDKEWNSGPECPTDSATTGYDYDSDDRGRHRLDFCHYDPDDRKGTEAPAVQAMMHELGHAIGLQHEHVRNDRNEFLDFRCENLEGYEEAKRLVEIDEQAHFEDDDELEDRLRLACADDDIASDYLPAAVAFVRAKDHRLATEKRKWKYYKRSGPFDFDSIMIYNSFANSPGSVDGMDPKNWVLKRKGKDGGTGGVWQGRSPKAAEARISEGDVARVCFSAISSSHVFSSLGILGFHLSLALD